MTIQRAIQALFHTSTKEVGYIETAYSKASKSKASKADKNQYENSVNKAVSRIRVDLYEVLKMEP